MAPVFLSLAWHTPRHSPLFFTPSPVFLSLAWHTHLIRFSRELDVNMRDLDTLSRYVADSPSPGAGSAPQPPLTALPYPFFDYEHLPANQHPGLRRKVEQMIRMGAGETALHGGGGSGGATRLLAEHGEWLGSL